MKEDNNIISYAQFMSEKNLYDLENKIKSIGGDTSKELDIVKTAKDILRGKLEAPFEVDIESFLL